MACLVVATRDVFDCRCGLVLFTRVKQGRKDPAIGQHQRICELAPGDTLQGDGRGHQPPELVVFLKIGSWRDGGDAWDLGALAWKYTRDG